MENNAPPSPLEELFAEHGIDTVMLAAPDLFGRLAGMRASAAHLADAERWAVSPSCLTTDLAWQAISPQREQGRLYLRPDVTRPRILPWLPATALLWCDLEDEAGKRVPYAPREILRRQEERLAEKGLRARFSVAVECHVFDEGEGASHGHAHDLLASGRQESLLRAIRIQLAEAGVPVAASIPAAGPGQHRLVLAEDTPLATAESCALLKHGVKELAALHDASATFMALCNEAHPPSACIISADLQAQDGGGLADDADPLGMSSLCRSWLAGQLHRAREMCLLFAPLPNSYARLTAEGEAFRRVTWQRGDASPCPLRVVGRGTPMRMEWAWGGADINLHLALAGILAAGMEGIEQKLRLPPPGESSASLPASIEEAIEAFGVGDALAPFQAAARCEARAQPTSDSASASEILAWQRQRGFEQA